MTTSCMVIQRLNVACETVYGVMGMAQWKILSTNYTTLTTLMYSNACGHCNALNAQQIRLQTPTIQINIETAEKKNTTRN